MRNNFFKIFGNGSKLILPFLFWYIPVFAQNNLVKNGGFELFNSCPTAIEQLTKLKYWKSLNSGTPEYFNDNCLFSETKPFEGNGYIGLISACQYETAIEYVTINLDSNLKKGQKYCLQFYVKAKEGPFYANGIGATFFDAPKLLNYWGAVYQKTYLFSKDIITPNDGWVKLQTIFTATGNEKVLAIGNFLEPEFISFQNNSDYKIESGWQVYYYIDNVYLATHNNGCEPQFTNTKNNLKIAQISVFFDLNQHQLNNEQLTLLQKFLTQYKNVHLVNVQVKAFTCYLGSSLYNQQLAERRSQFVKSEALKIFNSPNLFLLNNIGENEIHYKQINEISKNRRVDLTIEYVDETKQ